jgi:hypothetical protein
MSKSMTIKMRKAAWISTASLLALLAAGCGAGGPEESPGFKQISAEASACGGFPADRARSAPAPLADYCAAEVLHWQYDAAAQTLSLQHTRAVLNCCGVRGVSIAEQDGAYLVTETDGPEDLGRCSCMCVYDFAVAAEGIPAGSIPLKVVLTVSDSPESSGTVFDGTLDLGAGAGEIVIDDQETPWCNPA